MRRLLVALVIALGMVTLYGFIMGDGRDPMRVSALVEKRLITVVVTMPKITDRYRWLSVVGCSAEMTDTGTFCTGRWELESTRELQGIKQVLIPWRDVPPGTMRITALVFDADHAVLASDQLTILRGE